MQSQPALETSWVAAADSKDHPGLEDRQLQISALLSQLTAYSAESWFSTCIVVLVQKTYPKQYRCLLDAMLQRFVALSPLHCGCVLQGFLSIPNPETLNAPFRRDLATLFKGPAKLSPTCWPQQGAVVCSIVSHLATNAAHNLWTLQQQQQQRQTAGSPARPQSAPQRVGTAISWLVDCMLQAAPQQQLLLMQLVLAVTVAEFSRLEQQQVLFAADQADMQPPTKRQRLSSGAGQHDSRQRLHVPATSAPATISSRSSSSGPSLTALQAGTSLLTAICCCERMQHGSQLLVPAAAAAAASAAASRTSKEVQLHALRSGAWLYQQLAARLTGVTSKHSAVPATPTSVQQQPQAPTSAAAAAAALLGVQPEDALGHILQQLVVANPSHIVGLVQLLMGTARSPVGPASSMGVALDKQQQQQQQWLVEAAQQWQPAPVPVGTGANKGKKGKQAKRQAVQTGAAGNNRSSTVEQLLSGTMNVNATWLCKHMVPVTIRQAAQAWDQQQQEVSRHDQSLPAAAAGLVELLAAAHLLLPAAGEVLVSARFLADALKGLEPDLQLAVATTWRQRLVQPLQSAGAAQIDRQSLQDSSSCVSAGFEWRALQPMLCLLNHLEQGSPFAAVLAAAVQDLVKAEVPQQQPSSTVGTAVAGKQSTMARDMVRHLLLPVRFALIPAVRVWLLQQLLCLDHQLWQKGMDDQTQPRAYGTQDAAAVMLNGLQQVLQQEAGKLAQGLQLMAAGMPRKAEDAGAVGAAAVTSTSDTMSPEQVQARQLAVVVVGVLQKANVLVNSKGGSGGQQLHDWSATVHHQLTGRLNAVNATAYAAVRG